MIDTTLTITNQTTEFEYDVDSIYFSAEIADMTITFEGNLICDGYMDLLFTVDGTLERLELPKRTKLAVTKWLLGCWAVAKTHHTKFSCCATDDDGSGWREAMYSKLGFVRESDAMIYN